MADLNKESMAIWKSLKPMIDEEIKAQTRGSVQRRKMKVTTAPSLVTNVIGVTEPYGSEMFIPFNTNLSAAHIGDVVWVEFMYGATNAFASMYASADTKDWTVGGDANIIGNATINGVLDVTQRRCSATLSSAGWYRVMKFEYANGSYTRGATGAEIVFHITRRLASAGEETHEIKMLCNLDNIAFVNESSLSRTQRIDKIRYTYTSAVAGYVDIHCSDACPNVGVWFEVYEQPDRLKYYTAESLQSVADAPAGETVLTTYEFTANGIRTVTLTSAHSSVTINAQNAIRSGNVVSLWVDFTVSASISGYDVLIYAPSFASGVVALVYNAGSTVQTNVRLYGDKGNWGLRCYEAFPAGRYVAFVTYITTDV